jgi:hypothetical protein
MDFVVSHIRNDKPVDVFVVCGTQLARDDEGDLFPGLDTDYGDYEGMDGMGPRQAGSRDTRKRPPRPQPGNGNKPPAVHSGEICVDLETEMEILAGVRIKPSMPLFAAEDNRLGNAVSPNFTSTIVSVNLSKEKLQKLGMENQEIYFQAAAIPVNNGNPFGEAQVSECDRYLVMPVTPEEEGGDPGTKMPDDNMPPPGDGTTQPPSDPGGKG